MKVKGVSFVNSSMLCVNEQKFFASTDGSRIEQYIVRSFPDFTVTAVDRATGDFQPRALGGPQGDGLRVPRDLSVAAEARAGGPRSGEKLKARSVAPGNTISCSIRRTSGSRSTKRRPLDGARPRAVVGGELRGHELPDARQDRQVPVRLEDRELRRRPHPAPGLATVGYDDEGVPGQRWYLVKDGVFVDWQTTRDLAPLSGGRARTAASTPTRGAACRSRACRTSRWSRQRQTVARRAHRPTSTTAS